jgi:hypothetical protein
MSCLNSNVGFGPNTPFTRGQSDALTIAALTEPHDLSGLIAFDDARNKVAIWDTNFPTADSDAWFKQVISTKEANNILETGYGVGTKHPTATKFEAFGLGEPRKDTAGTVHDWYNAADMTLMASSIDPKPCMREILTNYGVIGASSQAARRQALDAFLFKLRAVVETRTMQEFLRDNCLGTFTLDSAIFQKTAKRDERLNNAFIDSFVAAANKEIVDTLSAHMLYYNMPSKVECVKCWASDQVILSADVSTKMDQLFAKSTIGAGDPSAIADIFTQKVYPRIPQGVAPTDLQNRLSFLITQTAFSYLIHGIIQILSFGKVKTLFDYANTVAAAGVLDGAMTVYESKYIAEVVERYLTDGPARDLLVSMPGASDIVTAGAAAAWDASAADRRIHYYDAGGNQF